MTLLVRVGGADDLAGTDLEVPSLGELPVSEVEPVKEPTMVEPFEELQAQLTVLVAVPVSSSRGDQIRP